MKQHPTSFRVHQLGAEVYEAQSNFDQAIREYRTALQEQPKLPEAHFRLGQLLLRKGGDHADETASAEFRSELQINPGSALSALALADIERHENQLDVASADYTLALRIDPALTEARTGLARVLLSQGKLSQAEEELHQVIQAKPEDAQAHYALMLTLRQQGNLQQAATEMETFKRLQAKSRSLFEQNLGALLTGSQTGSSMQGAAYQ
jgi:Tfp pilus assembly protein PilF